MHLDVSLEQIYEFDGGVAGIIYGESGSTLSDVYINAFNYTYDPQLIQMRMAHFIWNW